MRFQKTVVDLGVLQRLQVTQVELNGGRLDRCLSLLHLKLIVFGSLLDEAQAAEVFHDLIIVQRGDGFILPFFDDAVDLLLWCRQEVLEFFLHHALVL